MEISNILNSTLDSRASIMQVQSRENEFSQFQTILEQSIERQNNLTELAEQTMGRSSLEVAERAQIREAAEMFESYFLNLMFREMRSTNFDADGFIPRGNAERIFTEMLDETISDKAAAQGGFGLADMLYMQMTQHFRDNRRED